jgi:hypothetical protein
MKTNPNHNLTITILPGTHLPDDKHAQQLGAEASRPGLLHRITFLGVASLIFSFIGLKIFHIYQPDELYSRPWQVGLASGIGWLCARECLEYYCQWKQQRSRADQMVE